MTTDYNKRAGLTTADYTYLDTRRELWELAALATSDDDRQWIAGQQATAMETWRLNQ